jgi:ATP-dependent Clp protease ATP-binding subunit ClpA
MVSSDRQALGGAITEEDRKFKKTVLALREELKKVIFGQDTAITVLERAIKISFSGLRTRNKTAGAFLFMGPSLQEDRLRRISAQP